MDGEFEENRPSAAKAAVRFIELNVRAEARTLRMMSFSAVRKVVPLQKPHFHHRLLVEQSPESKTSVALRSDL